MPKIYEYFGIAFLFYANDHEPVHIHAKKGGYENKIVFVYSNGKLIEIKAEKVRGKNPLPANDLKDAMDLAKVKKKEILNKWVDFYAKKKILTCEKITKKL